MTRPHGTRASGPPPRRAASPVTRVRPEAPPARTATPRFSVLIPVWRGADWIGRAIDSVRRQSTDDWEIVVGDNASDDGTAEIARSVGEPRIRVESWRDHLGIFDNFNRSFARCRGEWVYLLPVDDALEPHALERIGLAIDDHRGSRELVAVLPRARRVAPDGSPVDLRYHGVQAEARIAGGTYDAAGWLRAVTEPGSPPWDGGAFRRSAIEAMGRFYRTDIPSMSADFELDIRIAALGDVIFLDEPLLAVTGSTASHTPSRIRRNLESGEPFTPRGRALQEGLRAHEAVRTVGSDERERVASAIARTHLRRATAHRTMAGGRGRQGALEDLRSAWRLSRGVTLRSLPQATLIILAPAWVIERVRGGLLQARAIMRRIGAGA